MFLVTEMLLLVSTAAQTFSPKASPETHSSPLKVTVALVKISECFKGVWMQQEAGNSHWDGRKGAGMMPRVPRRGFAAEPSILLLLLDSFGRNQDWVGFRSIRSWLSPGWLLP